MNSTMTVDEVSALLFRIQDAYPHAAVRQGTLEEWRASALARFSADVVFAAFDRYRDANDKPPSIASLVSYAQAEARSRVQDRMLPRSTEPAVPREVGASNVTSARRVLLESRRLGRALTDAEVDAIVAAS